jgi:hypothetical protein
LEFERAFSLISALTQLGADYLLIVRVSQAVTNGNTFSLPAFDINFRN